MKEPEIWYRYEGRRYADFSEWEVVTGTHVDITLHHYYVKNHTPKGVRFIGGRLVLHASNKKFACPTKELALESFLARKDRHRRILENQLSDVNKLIAMAKGELPLNTWKQRYDKEIEQERTASVTAHASGSP
jgi:hypothetical protein